MYRRLFFKNVQLFSKNRLLVATTVCYYSMFTIKKVYCNQNQNTMQEQKESTKQTFKISQATMQETKQDIRQETTQQMHVDQHEDVTQEVNLRLQKENGKLGIMTASLTWNTLDDLDLSCILPNGRRIYFFCKKMNGGILDVDMNVGGTGSKRPIENIYWPNEPEKGIYTFCVHNFRNHETPQFSKIHFCLTIRIGNQIHHEFGYLYLTK